MKTLLISISIFLLVLSGCVEGEYIIGEKIYDSSLENSLVSNNLDLGNEIPRRDDINEIGECTIIDEEGEYELTNDIEGNEICIDIQSSNVMLDCKGNTIIGNLEENSIGIRALDENSLTIKNCELIGWYKGIHLENVDNSEIVDNIVTNVEDSYKLEYENNKFNLNDTAYDIDNKLTRTQLPMLLEDGIFLDNVGENRGEVEYVQELIFTNRGSSVEKTIQYIYNQNKEHEDKLMGDYIYLSKSSGAYTWTYNFDLDESITVDNSADIQNTKLNLLGRIFTISSVTVHNNNVTKLVLLSDTNADEIVLENGEGVIVNDNIVERSKVMFGGNLGFDQFNISFRPDDRVYLKPGEDYEDPIFGAFKLIFGGIVEDNMEEINIDASDDKVELTATNKEGDTTTWGVAVALEGNIMPGSDDDEPFIALERDFVTNNSLGSAYAEDLGEMEDIRFLYSMNGVSRIIRITEIDTNENRTDFYDETTGTSFQDQDFILEEDTSFTFLPSDFKLNFSRSRASGEEYDIIRFSDINDQGSSFFLENGGNLTFWASWSNHIVASPNFITFSEVDDSVEENIPLNIIGINFTYSPRNEEINFAAVYADKDFVHRSEALKQKDRDDTTIKAGKTIYGTYVEQLTPTMEGTDMITIRTPNTATYAEIWISSKDTERTGIEMLNSDNNLIIDNTFCYSRDDIKVNNGNNEFLYNQFDTIEGLELEGMPCGTEEHEIQIDEGWNLISSYLVPYYSNIEAIFGKLARSNKLIILKDEQGRFFRPENDYNNIPEWNSQEGYQIKVSENTELVIKGEERVDSEIELDEGWNYIAYPLEESRSMQDIIDNVLNELGDNLIMIKDNSGRFYNRAYGYSNIPTMRAGQGYQIKVSEDSVIDFS